MNLIKYIAVNIYLNSRLSKLYNDGGIYMTYPSDMSRRLGLGKFVPFEFHKTKDYVIYRDYVKQHLNVCYDHAATILLGLKNSDKCVIGYGPCGRLAYKKNECFYHAWNEFQYNNDWYVYDNQNNKIYKKDYFYNKIRPKIIESWTLEEVLKLYEPIKQEYSNYDFIKIIRNYENKGKIIKTDYNLNMHQLYVGDEIKIDKNGNVESARVYMS